MSDFPRSMGVIEAEAKLLTAIKDASDTAGQEAIGEAKAAGLTPTEVHTSAVIAKAVVNTLEESLDANPDLRILLVIEHAVSLLDAIFASSVRAIREHQRASTAQ